MAMMLRSAIGGILRRSGAARLPAGRRRISSAQEGHDKVAREAETLLGKLASLSKAFVSRHWTPLEPGEKILTIGGMGFLALVINKDIESSAILAKQKALLEEKRTRAASRRRGHDGYRA
ncbi:hypothetical protein EJB05_25458 [Eragrostis curvula]|uniref:Uncharacterized protein n=1 Tax=Eragrostis curvula TaxID=38414 RepID=A0A5J9VBH7_9POAL|nr:hypothetical protein EJB05_25458 [Eragrostis curvula]